jgi:hypothetical protein
MPFCPSCHYEYREGIEKCPDCDKKLVAKLPASKPKKKPEPVDLIDIYHGDLQTVTYLQEMLSLRGIASIIAPAIESLWSSRWTTAQMLNAPQYQKLLISSLDVENHRFEVEECLALIADPDDQSR